MSPVLAAVATVDYDAWARHPDGTWIPQTSAPEVVQAMLERLDPSPGQCVLEVGTGSRYSAAVLVHLLGPQGRLVSLDVDPDLVERAQRLHCQAGHSQVEVHRADGFGGWPPAVPFEGIVAWCHPPAAALGLGRADGGRRDDRDAGQDRPGRVHQRRPSLPGGRR